MQAKKALDRLKQSLRAWFSGLGHSIKNMDLSKTWKSHFVL